MGVLDKVGMATFADVDSEEARDRVYREIENWYKEETKI